MMKLINGLWYSDEEIQFWEIIIRLGKKLKRNPKEKEVNNGIARIKKNKRI